MFYEKIDLYAYFGKARGAHEGGTLAVYAREQSGDLGKKLRPAALVIAGGGYGYVSAREQEPVALSFLAAGYAVFVLTYTVGTAYPVPFEEGIMAMRFVRAQAEKYSVDPAHVAVVGFSAGGHLAGLLATLESDPMAEGEGLADARPDAAVLCYPVISGGEFGHAGTMEIISGGDGGLLERLSVEKRVTADSAPVFLWHTMEDSVVPVENSLLLAAACRRAGVPFELHVFEKGRHGLSVAGIETETDPSVLPQIAHLRVWVELALSWLRGRGFTVSA